MVEPPARGRASRTAGRDDEADFARQWPEATAGRPRRSLGWGHYPAWVGVLMVLAVALLGTAFTVATHSDPGRALGIFVVAGTVAAGTGVRARSAYATVPVPALAYTLAAVIAGLIHDRAIDTSRTALTISGVQWVGNGFIAMSAATVLAVVLAVARWLLSVHYARASQ